MQKRCMQVVFCLILMMAVPLAVAGPGDLALDGGAGFYAVSGAKAMPVADGLGAKVVRTQAQGRSIVRTDRDQRQCTSCHDRVDTLRLQTDDATAPVSMNIKKPDKTLHRTLIAMTVIDVAGGG